MKEKKLELKQLNRAELIEIIYELQKQNEENTARIAQMQEMLSDRELRISSAGSIAEAALSINGVLEAAQAAADQYLLSIKAATADMANQQETASKQRQSMLQDAEQQAAQTVRLAEEKAQRILEDAERQAAEKWAQFEKRANELIAAHTELQSLMQKGR